MRILTDTAVRCARRRFGPRSEAQPERLEIAWWRRGELNPRPRKPAMKSLRA